MADKRISPRSAICALARLVMVSPMAIRPEAGASINARGVRSPIAITSPVVVSKVVVVTAQLPTGTCHGPTICSPATIPVIDRSPIVIKKLLLATAGRLKTRWAASARSTSCICNACNWGLLRVTSRCILGGLPNSTDIGKSTGLLAKWVSPKVKWCSSVASPTMA